MDDLEEAAAAQLAQVGADALSIPWLAAAVTTQSMLPFCYLVEVRELLLVD